MNSFTSPMSTLLFGLVSIVMHVQAADRGLAWGADNTWATAFDNTSVKWVESKVNRVDKCANTNVLLLIIPANFFSPWQLVSSLATSQCLTNGFRYRICSDELGPKVFISLGGQITSIERKQTKIHSSLQRTRCSNSSKHDTSVSSIIKKKNQSR